MTDVVERFRDRTIRFAEGAAGEVVEIASANPANYHALVQAGRGGPAMPPQQIDGQLFLPANRKGRVPVVVVVPGSLSVAPSHVGHAETFVGMGFAAFVLDPFGGRGVVSTVSNQTQFSFAASVYDVIATVKALSARPEIDASRIGIQGHSRGGTAVLNAAMRGLNTGFFGSTVSIRAVLAAYPWAGQQMLDPDVGGAEIRVLMGDRDDWCSPQQVQGYVQAIRLRGGSAAMRLFAGAAHSFDRGTPIQSIPTASVSPGAPTSYIAEDGSFVHPVSGVSDPKLVDRDLAVYALKAGYGVKGATLGTKGDEHLQFREEMKAFFGRTLG